MMAMTRIKENDGCDEGEMRIREDDVCNDGDDENKREAVRERLSVGDGRKR